MDTIYNALNDSWEKQKEVMGLKSFYPYYGNIMTPISRFDMDSLMTSHTAGLKYFWVVTKYVGKTHTLGAIHKLCQGRRLDFKSTGAKLLICAQKQTSNRTFAMISSFFPKINGCQAPVAPVLTVPLICEARAHNLAIVIGCLKVVFFLRENYPFKN